MLLASWKKDLLTGAWLINAPGAVAGSIVKVVAKSGKAKLVKLHGAPKAVSGYWPEYHIMGQH